MGYGTAVYGVDINRLRAATGSRDAHLLRLVLDKWRELCADTTVGPRVRITVASQFILDGRPISSESELVEELLKPECEGQSLHWFIEPGEKQWSGGAFIRVIAAKVKSKFPWFCGYSDEKDFRTRET